jgi:adenylate cyclase
MVDCVNRYGGTLHKFIGDAILAVWGDTLSEGSHKDCTQALNAALDMRMELLKLNARWKQEKRPLLKIGIGINLGHVIVGNIGAPQRMEFTVIGDTVNTASRLEGVTKQYKLDIVVGDSFAETVKDEFAFQTLGLVKPPGKAQGVKIFHPMAPFSVFSPEDKAWLEAYEKGLDLFFGKKFAESLPIFESCHAQKPDNWPAELHIKLARHNIENPPDEHWTGLRDVDK